MDRQAGFTVGPTVQRCTRGLWIWGRPKIGLLPSGEQCWTLLLDTEGIGGLEADAQYDARIFSLATLLCSTLVYNSLGSIDENAIGSLSFIANLTQHIRISSKTGISSEEEALQLHQFFPAFLWVIRDFALDLVDEDGEQLTANEYLEKSLGMQAGFDKATSERNRIRHMLTSFFQERRLVTLVRPINDEQALQRVDNVPYRNLRPEFRESMEFLKKQIFEQIKPKSMNGRDLNGAMFAGLVQAYVQAINEGGVPTISSAWEGVSRQECGDAVEAALAYAREQIANMFGGRNLTGLPQEYEELAAKHRAVCKEAIHVYDQRAVGDSALTYRSSLQEQLESEFARLCQANTNASQQACEALLQTLFAELLHQDIHGTGSFSGDTGATLSVELLQQKFEALRQRYFGRAVGPAKEEQLALFALARWPEAATALQQRLDVQHEKQMQKQEEDLISARAEVDALNLKVQTSQHKAIQAEEELTKLRSDNSSLQAQLDTQQSRLDKALSQLTQAEIRIEEKVDEAVTQRGAIKQAPTTTPKKSMDEISEVKELEDLLT